jgi:hypothetical protein
MPEAFVANPEPGTSEQVIQQLQAEIKRLQRLVFHEVPMKRGGIGRLWAKPAPGFGGATDYEAWLRTLESQDLQHLIKLHTGAIDSLRYRRRFVQHEAERRFLHSSYGKHPFEHLAEMSRGIP